MNENFPNVKCFGECISNNLCHLHSKKNSLFITGGTSRNANGILASSEYVYANGTVESGPDMPVARYGHCMVTLHDGKVMILGSYDPASLHKNVIIMDPATNSFSSGPSLNYVRRDAGCTLFNSALHHGRPVDPFLGALVLPW